MLPKPRTSRTSKSKRSSAPPKQLGNELPLIKDRNNPTLGKSKSKDGHSDNVFDLLDFTETTTTDNNYNNPFMDDFFTDNKTDNNNKKNTNNTNNNTNNTTDNNNKTTIDNKNKLNINVNTNNTNKPLDKRMSVNTQIYTQLQNVWDDFGTLDSPLPESGSSPMPDENKNNTDFFNLFSDNVNTNNKNTNNKNELDIIGEDKENTKKTDEKDGDDGDGDDEEEVEDDSSEEETNERNNNHKKTELNKNEKTNEKITKNNDKNEDKNTKDNNTNDNKNETNEDTKSKSKSNPKKITNSLEELWRGTALLKYPRRHGFPHFKYIQLSSDNTTLQWFSKKKTMQQTCIKIKDIREVRKGQETEVFRKFHQQALERASFSVVFGFNYKTLDLVAKSTEECEMWVKSLQELVKRQRNGEDVTKIKKLDVGVTFRDRNRPKSRNGGSGRFIRSNESKSLKIDPNAMKQLEKDMEKLHQLFNKLTKLAKEEVIVKSSEYGNISKVLSELEERIEELSHEVHNTRDTEMSKRDVWRANVDLSAVEEKLLVLKAMHKKRTSIFG